MGEGFLSPHDGPSVARTEDANDNVGSCRLRARVSSSAARLGESGGGGKGQHPQRSCQGGEKDTLLLTWPSS